MLLTSDEAEVEVGFFIDGVSNRIELVTCYSAIFPNPRALSWDNIILIKSDLMLFHECNFNDMQSKL